MTLLELQQWLGRRLPSRTLHYVKASDSRMTTVHAGAPYFERNMRLVDVAPGVACAARVGPSPRLSRVSSAVSSATGGSTPARWSAR
jgi:hypothetical protein